MLGLQRMASLPGSLGATSDDSTRQINYLSGGRRTASVERDLCLNESPQRLLGLL